MRVCVYVRDLYTAIMCIRIYVWVYKCVILGYMILMYICLCMFLHTHVCVYICVCVCVCVCILSLVSNLDSDQCGVLLPL